MTPMTGSDDNGKNPVKPRKSVQPGSRDARLAAALRENLRRRKMQERGRERGRDGQNGAEAAGTPPDGENR
jgi:hypothetical protein